MANDLLDKIPDWLKSLWHMENELRNSARNGLILRKDEATTHMGDARRHLEEVMKSARVDIRPADPTPPLRGDGTSTALVFGPVLSRHGSSCAQSSSRPVGRHWDATRVNCGDVFKRRSASATYCCAILPSS